MSSHLPDFTPTSVKSFIWTRRITCTIFAIFGGILGFRYSMLYKEDSFNRKKEALALELVKLEKEALELDEWERTRFRDMEHIDEICKRYIELKAENPSNS